MKGLDVLESHYINRLHVPPALAKQMTSDLSKAILPIFGALFDQYDASCRRFVFSCENPFINPVEVVRTNEAAHQKVAQLRQDVATAEAVVSSLKMEKIHQEAALEAFRSLSEQLTGQFNRLEQMLKAPAFDLGPLTAIEERIWASLPHRPLTGGPTLDLPKTAPLPASPLFGSTSPLILEEDVQIELGSDGQEKPLADPECTASG
ncbi:hypothetical protein PAPYR_3804 [Paratrimastix pyriformis]|uniref:Uncharacterized protein n=1 Tax=Paratrimastix pyriformis TaxID=342808 RepID=A0ABQ8UQV1_9EUKA|nr:hypothetical protein PAPYR_3804 [Paratrimastix pyriformis]